MDRHGSPTFYKMLEEMAETHDKKSHDYASDSNPSGNYHFAGQLSLLFAHESRDAGFVGRLGEKLYRLANLESSSKVPLNESIADTERDLCVIMVLWMADRRNRRAKATPFNSSENAYSQIIQKEIFLTSADRKNLISYLQGIEAKNDTSQTQTREAQTR